MAQPNITHASIGIRARERVDMVGSDFVSATEEENYIESSWKEFYMWVVSKHEDIFVNTKIRTGSIGTSSLDLNPLEPGGFEDFLKFRAIQHRDFATGRIGPFLEKIDFREQFRVSSATSRGKPTHYALHTQAGSEPQVTLYPTPDQAYSFLLWYVPFRSLRDWIGLTGRMRFLAGWDEIVVLSVATKMRDKEEGDCSVLLAEKAQLMDLFSRGLTPFDEGEPGAVVQHTPRINIYDTDPFDLEDYFG